MMTQLSHQCLGIVATVGEVPTTNLLVVFQLELLVVCTHVPVDNEETPLCTPVAA